jgi:hypothetical protein
MEHGVVGTTVQYDNYQSVVVHWFILILFNNTHILRSVTQSTAAANSGMLQLIDK